MSEFDQLLASIKNRKNPRRHHDVSLLEYMHDSRSASTLNEIVSDRSESDQVRTRAVDIIAEKGDVNSLPVLKAYKDYVILKLGHFSDASQITSNSMLAVYQRVFPPAQAPAMKAAATTKAESKLPFVRRADVIMPGDSALTF